MLNKALTTVNVSAFSDCDALVHVGYPGSQEEYAKINISSNNNSLTNVPYLHCNFAPQTDLTEITQADATCTQDGSTAGLYCAHCELWLEGGETIQAKGHTYTLTDQFAGSCTQAPYETYVCSQCQDTHTVWGNISQGHDYVTTVVAPTCTEKGYTLQACSLCSETAISCFTAPTGHRLSIGESQDHCQGHGSCLYRCSECDYWEYVAADASELQTKTLLVEPTCTQSGSETVVCTLCDATVSLRFLAAVGHTPRTDPATGAVTCSVCSHVITPAVGVTLSGSIKSAGTGTVTVELWAGDERISSLTSEDGSYAFGNLTAGDYILRISKVNHITREYCVTVAVEDTVQNVTVCLKGDINGDGRVNAGDVGRLYSHIKGTNPITDQYSLLCANVNGNSLNISDVSSLYSPIKGTKFLY